MSRCAPLYLLPALLLAGCPSDGGGSADPGFPDDAVTDASTIGTDTVTPVDADGGPDDVATAPSHPFLAAPDLSGCAAKVCAFEGSPYSQMKAWYGTNGGCAVLPETLACQVKAELYGSDWPAKAEARIQAASAAVGGFSEAQVASLRCLAFLEPSGEFNVGGEVAGSGSPSRLALGLTLDLDGDADAVAAAFLDRMGPYIGTAYGVMADYGLETKVTSYSGFPGASGAVNVRVVAKTFKGIPLRDSAFFDITLSPVYAAGASGDAVCAGRYRWGDDASGAFDGRLADVRIDEAGRIPVETAIQQALTSCGGTCHALETPVTSLELTVERLQYRVQVGCPSHCSSFPDWTCTYTVDAYSGQVLGGGEDCCVDCFE